ncbi:transporter [Flavobacterium cyanobacteriorum]|uniref:Transporter n=1 Tax=Flavobacterium cyanobacteriorum TaxID=2022802 RepID=A0A255YXP2_9FLAO|nr:TolC family protein [Flavobacterium cyanobacteriorum]OYQ33190.1 transporter [Flavobacterium cyanobacteriorum]
MRHRYSILFTTLLLTFKNFGQDTIVIFKKEVAEKASAKNLEIKIAGLEYRLARSDYRQSNAVFLPGISASYTAISTTNPLMAFGSKLNQEILTASDFDPRRLNNPDNTQNFAVKVEILQPLLNMDGLFARKAAKSKMEAYELQTTRTQEYLELESGKAYMELQLAYKAVSVLEKALVTAQSNLALIENYYNQGLLQKTDLLAAMVREYEIKNQLQYAKSNLLNASGHLAFLMNEDINGKVFKPAEEAGTTIVPAYDRVITIDNRKDILAMSKSGEAYKRMWQSSRMGVMPRLNAFVNYELYDDKLFQADANGYTVGLQLSWNVFDGYKLLGKMEKAKAEMEKAEVEKQQYTAKSLLEIDKVKCLLKDTENKVNLSVLALEQSKEAYRIRSNRFAQGLEKAADLLTGESLMLQKELEMLLAIYEYNFTQQYLEFLTR